MRRVLGIRIGHNPKGLGLFLAGHSALYRRRPSEPTLRAILRLLTLVGSHRTQTASGHGWGYNFDWQSRVFFVPRGTPSIVASSFIGHALLDVHEVLRDARALDLAVPASRFILDDLNRISAGDGFCFSYTPRDRYAVHNANLLGASLLIRIAAATGDTRCRDAALCSLAYSMRHQREDGSWFYSENPRSRWIDSFHTGFVLESIRHFLRLGEVQQHRAAYERGVAFYASRFFLSDGTPKYYDRQTYPIDIHSSAEAISFFSAEPGYAELARRVLDWTLANMWDPSGYFYFRRTPYFTNKIPYMRWSQSWMFRALTSYVTQCR